MTLVTTGLKIFSGQDLSSFITGSAMGYLEIGGHPLAQMAGCASQVVH
jgi:hypothetical protein